MKFTPYLTFDGTCEAAMNLYVEIFGAKIVFMQKFGDAPESEGMPPNSADRIMHAHLDLGGSSLMASDSWGEEVTHSGMSVQMGYDTVEEARRVFEALSEGGNVVMDFQPTFWSAGFGIVNDRFGVPWLINCDVEPS